MPTNPSVLQLFYLWLSAPQRQRLQSRRSQLPTQRSVPPAAAMPMPARSQRLLHQMQSVVLLTRLLGVPAFLFMRPSAGRTEGAPRFSFSYLELAQAVSFRIQSHLRVVAFALPNMVPVVGAAVSFVDVCWSPDIFLHTQQCLSGPACCLPIPNRIVVSICPSLVPIPPPPEHAESSTLSNVSSADINSIQTRRSSVYIHHNDHTSIAARPPKCILLAFLF